MILITDCSGRIEYVNAAVTSITGYEKEEVIGETPALFRWPATGPELYASMWQTILAGENWSGEILNRKKNGDLYWASLSISPVRSDDGVITHFIGIQEDITQKRRLQTRAQALARFPQQNPNPVLRVGRSGEILFANDANKELTPLFSSQSHDRVTEA